MQKIYPHKQNITQPRGHLLEALAWAIPTGALGGVCVWLAFYGGFAWLP